VFCNDVCSVMEVLGHEYNPDQWRLFIDSSKASLKVILLHFLWLLKPTRRKVMKGWGCCWERLSMTNLNGSYLGFSRLWHCNSECNSCTQNTAVSCASGTAGTRRIAMQINCDLNEHHWRQRSKMSSVLLLFFRKTFTCPICT
jgi:hypothetical protein